jgi:hypothetical protein
LSWAGKLVASQETFLKRLVLRMLKSERQKLRHGLPYNGDFGSRGSHIQTRGAAAQGCGCYILLLCGTSMTVSGSTAQFGAQKRPSSLPPLDLVMVQV